MKALRCCFIGTFFWAWLLLIGQSVVAEDFDLGIATSPEGTTLGENLNIEMDKTTGIKYLSGLKGGGKLDISVQLSTKFEITIVGNWDPSIKISLTTETGNNIWLWDSYYDDVKGFGTELIKLSKLNWHYSTAKTKNTVKWSVEGENANLYINNMVAAKTIWSNSESYTHLVISGIDDADRIFEITGNDESEDTTDLSTTGPFEDGKQAGIQQCKTDPASCGISMTGSGTGGVHANFNPSTGELYIPLVDVPGAFGGVQTYEIYLKQQPLKFSFDLDMNRLTLK
jgi:hypothetical protein